MNSKTMPFMGVLFAAAVSLAACGKKDDAASSPSVSDSGQPNGSVTACDPGYVSNAQGVCEDINECETKNGGCDKLTACTNTPGGRTCGPCPDGFGGDGESGCIDPNIAKEGETVTGGATEAEFEAFKAAWKPELPPDRIEIEANPNLKPVTQAQANVVQVEPHLLRFPVEGNADLEFWEAGRLVVSAASNVPGKNPMGFARKVVEVKREGDSYVVLTETPAFSELFTGEMQVAFNLETARVIAWEELDLEWAAENLYTNMETLADYVDRPLRLNRSSDDVQPSTPGGDPFWGKLKSAVGTVVKGVGKVVQATYDFVTPTSLKGDVVVRKELTYGTSFDIFNIKDFKYPVKGPKDLNFEVSLSASGKLLPSLTFQPNSSLHFVVPNKLHSKADPGKLSLDIDSLLQAKLGVKVNMEAKFGTADGGPGDELGNLKKLEEKISQGSEVAIAAMEAYEVQSLGDADKKPVGGFKKTLFVSTPLMQTVMAGPVPVVFTQTFQIDLECGFELRAELNAFAEVNAGLTFKFKAEFDEAKKTASASMPKLGTIFGHTAQVTGAGEVQVACGLIPRVNAFVYDMVGINVGLRGSVVGRASYESSCEENIDTWKPKGEVELGVDINLGVQVGGRVQAPGSSYAGAAGTAAGFDIGPFEVFTKNFNIFEKTWDVFGLGYCSSPCVNGSLDRETESDIDCGGKCPTSCQSGKKCQKNSDCANGLYCGNGVCGSDHCQDGVVSGNETAIDCGGACGKCGNGSYCRGDSDCQSNQCSQQTVKVKLPPMMGKKTLEMKQWVCVADACTDGQLSKGECGIDCGGSCGACKNGAVCGQSDQCESGFSNGTLCVANACQNKVRDGDETDVDCGGKDCNSCPDSNTCNVDRDCTSGACIEGKCLSASMCPFGDSIISAVWFNGDNKADVTASVRKLLNEGQTTFELRNSVLGQDPAPGVAKTFTLTYWDWGQVKTITKAEREFFTFPDLERPVRQVKSGWYHKGDRGGLVTGRLNALVRQGQTSFAVENTVLEIDPVYGHKKTLKVDYYDGQCRLQTKSAEERTTFTF